MELFFKLHGWQLLTKRVVMPNCSINSLMLGQVILLHSDSAVRIFAHVYKFVFDKPTNCIIESFLSDAMYVEIHELQRRCIHTACLSSVVLDRRLLHLYDVTECANCRTSRSTCSTASAVGRAVRSCDVIVTINSLIFLSSAESSSSKSTAVGISAAVLTACYISSPRPFSASPCRISNTEKPMKT